MNNKKKDWLMDLSDEQVANMNLCNDYPFLISPAVSCDKNYTYEFTAYDNLRKGWKIAFGKQLLDDIKAIYKMSKNKDFFYVKFSNDSLDVLSVKFIYDTIDNDLAEDMSKLNEKYNKLSRETCANCGKKIKDEFLYCKECTKAIMKGE